WVRLFPPMGGDASSNPGCSAEAAPRPGAPRPLVGPVASAQEQGSVSTRATSAHLSNFAAVLRAAVLFGLRLTRPCRKEIAVEPRVGASVDRSHYTSVRFVEPSFLVSV